MKHAPFQPAPRQALLLWRLLFLGEEPKLSDIQPRLSPAERRELVDAGLIELEPRGRATHVRLSERAYTLVPTHMDVPIARSQHAAPVLHAVLVRLKAYLQARELPLVELLTAHHDTTPPAPVAETTLDMQIRLAYLEATGHRLGERIRLRELRLQLRDVPRAALDTALVALQRQGQAVLLGLDDPSDCDTADHQAALWVAGEPRHLLYLVST